MTLPFDLADVDRIVFYKRDELTTDLICCDVEAGGKVGFFHEEAEKWDEVVKQFETLPGFRTDWFSSVSLPLFDSCETLAYERK